MGRPKVLVVDDDPHVRHAVVRLLEPWCDTDSLPGGSEALEAIRLGCRPDLVLTDVDMPMVDGPSLFRSSMDERLLSRDSFIFMSGSQTGERISFLLREQLLVLRKPLEPDQLLGAVETRLSEKALTKLRRIAKVVA